MDWSDIGSKIAGMGAQLLGEAVPIPGAGIAADAVAKALGTKNEPDAIAKALEQDPEAAAKLKQAEMDHKAELERIKAEARAKHESEITSRQAAVNDTMQVGYKQGVLWRRAVGWSLAIVIPLVVVGIFSIVGIAIYMGRPELIQHIAAVMSSLNPVWYVYMAVLGIAGWQEGKMGRAMAGDSEGGISKAIKAIKSK